MTTLVAVALGAGLAAPSALADLQIQSFEARVETATGELETRAGVHPFAAKAAFRINKSPDEGRPSESMKTVRVSLPAGLIGNPEALPKCGRAEFLNIMNPNVFKGCPPETQVGLMRLTGLDGFEYSDRFPIFNLEPTAGTPADFAFLVAGVPVHIVPSVRSDGDYGFDMNLENISTALPVVASETIFWGEPMSDAHTPDRSCTGGNDRFGCDTDTPRRAFLTNPSVCDRTFDTALGIDSWFDPGDFKTAFSTTPTTGTECDKLVFEPTISTAADTRRTDSPLGLTVDIDVPQPQDPDGRATPPLRKAVAVLPEGVAISPASADGLGACSDAELGLGSRAQPTCPEASKIGTVSLTTPLLGEPMAGDIVLRTPQPGQLFRLALVIRGPGLLFKLPGIAQPDHATGRITTTFDDNPQLPFSKLRLTFKDGPRAPLSTPQSCGEKTTAMTLESWGGPAATPVSSFAVDRDPSGGACPASAPFAPGFSAGTANPVAGAASPFSLTLTRRDGDQEIKTVNEVQLPEGLLARLGSVPVCRGDRAGAGTCGSESRIGHVQTAAGAGSQPLWLPQAGKAPTGVYLAGPYKGAPYSLSIVVPAQAGPFDLGTVVVRAALHVDPDDAQVTVKSDPLPHILEGVPLRLREIRVLIDRPSFALNPTSCEEKRIEGVVGSLGGATAKVGTRFQAGECAALGFRPRLGMRLVGERRMRSGGHPALRAVLRQGNGQANIRAAKVRLPRNVVLDSENAYDPKLLCGYDAALKADCPRSSRIGKASLRTPLLSRPLAGPVHLVQGIRFENGNRIRTLPTLLVKLRGEVAINLRSKTSIDGRDRLVSTFPSVPDARAAKFSLQINGGKKGILVVTENRRGRINLCSSRQTALVETDGHNGKRADYSVRVKTPCGASRGLQR